VGVEQRADEDADGGGDPRVDQEHEDDAGGVGPEVEMEDEFADEQQEGDLHGAEQPEPVELAGDELAATHGQREQAAQHAAAARGRDGGPAEDEQVHREEVHEVAWQRESDAAGDGVTPGEFRVECDQRGAGQCGAQRLLVRRPLGALAGCFEQVRVECDECAHQPGLDDEGVALRIFAARHRHEFDVGGLAGEDACGEIGRHPDGADGLVLRVFFGVDPPEALGAERVDEDIAEETGVGVFDEDRGEPV